MFTRAQKFCENAFDKFMEARKAAKRCAVIDRSISGLDAMLIQRNMLRPRAGFTLIELMVTVAIIGLLMAIAIPKYMALTTRAAAAEAVTVGQGVQSAVADIYSSNGGTGPAFDAGIASLNASYAGQTQISKYISAISVTDSTGLWAGDIILTYGPNAPAAIVGTTLELTPSVAMKPLESPTAIANPSFPIDWACSSAGVATATLEGLKTTTAATLPVQYAPKNCT